MSSKWLNWVDGDRGVSPVIGVILMVAIVVLLVGIAGTYAFTTADDSLDTTGQERDRLFDQLDEKSGTTDSDSDGDDSSGDGGSGDDGSGDGGGTEEVVGSVSVNPDISGAEVTAFDADGNEIATNTTESDGSYQLSYSEDETIESVVVVVDGFEDYGDNKFYASYEKTGVSSGESVEFEFDNVETVTVEGTQTANVSYSVTDSTNSVKHIGTVEQLQAINDVGFDKDYQLVSDVDASETNEWNSGSGFEPIGGDGAQFNGEFDGQEHEINGLTIDRPDEDRERNFGLIGETGSDAIVHDVGLTNVDVSGGIVNGGLIGLNNGDVKSSYVDGGVVKGNKGDTGGLIGETNSGSVIEDSYTDVTVDSRGYGLGGLVGQVNNGEIDNSYANGDVEGDEWFSVHGGLVGGLNDGGSIIDSYATGDVNGYENMGGLVGQIQDDSSVKKSYATGSVTGEYDSSGGIGGFVGRSEGSIEKSYATGDVEGDNNIGGFVGENYAYDSGGSLTNVYATGGVTGVEDSVGGLIGSNTYSEHEGTATNSYWNTKSTGQSNSGGEVDAEGLTTDEMQGSNAESNMDGFDFSGTWTTVDDDYPELE